MLVFSVVLQIGLCLIFWDRRLEIVFRRVYVALAGEKRKKLFGNEIVNLRPINL